MKIIISHDIDHWRWSDHVGRDLFIPKHLARTMWHGVRGRLSASSFVQRFAWMWERRQHRLDELLEFNDTNGVPATYFVGVANGLGLSYSLDTSGEIVRWLAERGCSSVGIHGIAYDQEEAIREEQARFRSLVGHDDFGMRMHYLRRSERTLPMLSAAGYAFDSTSSELRRPYWIGEMVEFPVGLMDVNVLSQGGNDLDAVKAATLERLRLAAAEGVDYFTINFHDPYFSEAYPHHRDWYAWIVAWLKAQGYPFVDFESARRALDEERARTVAVSPSIDMNL